MNSDSKLLTIQEAAKLLDVSTKTLRRWEEKGILVPQRTPGNQRRYALSGIEAFKLEQKNAVTQAYTIEKNISLQTVQPISGKITYVKDSLISKISAQTLPLEKVFAFTAKDYGLKSVFDLITPFQKKIAFGVVVALGVSLFVTVGVKTTSLFIPSEPETDRPSASLLGLSDTPSQAVLGIADAKTLFNFNIPVLLKDDTELQKNLLVGGDATVSGTLTAPNVVNAIRAGTGLSVVGGQTPTITNTDLGSAQNVFKTMKVGSTSISAGSNTDTFSFAAGSNISLSTDTTNKKLTIAASTTFSGITLAGTSGTNQTLSDGDTLTLAADNGITTTAASTDKVTVGLDVTTTSTTTTTNANSGLETSSTGLSLLRGCSDTQVLSWDATNVYWKCASSGGVGGSGTAGTLPKFSATSTLADSLISESGTTISLSTATALSASSLATITTAAGLTLSGATSLTASSLASLTTASSFGLNGASTITTDQTSLTLFNTTATTINFGGAATTALNLGNGSGNYTAINLGSGSGTHTINIAGTGATGADTINIGNGGTGADTITVGNNASTTSLAFTSGTGAQTFTSSVVSGTTTTSAFVMNASALTSGTALYLTSTATSGKLLDLNATETSGTIFNLAYGAAASLGGSLTGQAINLSSTNLTVTNQSVTGSAITIPTVTNTITSGTKTLTGVSITTGSGGGINQNGAGGTTTFTGVDVTVPAITQTAGTLNAYGVAITTPSSITTGGTTAGLYVNATGVGAGTLYGVNITNVTAGAGTEYALNVESTGWDAVLRVGSTTVINGSGVTQAAGGGTAQSTYATGDILYASAANTLSKLTIGGTTGYVLRVAAGGVPEWGTVAGSNCSTCVITDPSSTQTIAPTGATTVGLSIRQTSTALGGNTPDIFNVTSSNGATKYFSVDYQGNVSTGAISNTTLTLTPTSDTTALTLVGTNVSSVNLQYINAKNAAATTGIFNLAYGAAQTLTGTIIGIRQDLSTNVTATNQAVTGESITLPGPTNTITSGTKAYTGISISGNSINQNGAGGTTNYIGADITIPALTQTAGTLNAYGAQITTPSSITTGGTAYGVYVNASGVGAGTLNGINISNITAGAGTEYGLSVGSGWDRDMNFVDTSVIVAIGDGGTLAFTDGTNTLCTLSDGGSAGTFSCGTSGTQGYWTRSSTTISPATSNDVVSVTSNDNTNATLAIVNNTATTLGAGGDTIGVVNVTSSSVSTGDLVNIAATGLTTGNAVSISSSSTAGGASGNSYLLNLSRSGANSNTAHTAYGLYSTVTNANVTSGTNVAGYFSASGATTANYGLQVAAISTAQTLNTGLDIGALSGATTSRGINIGALSSATSTGIAIGNFTGATTNTGINIGTLGTATTSKGIVLGALSSATSTGVEIGALSGSTANRGVSIGAITAAATANNFAIDIGAITPQASATVASINTSGIAAGAGTTTYGINIGTNASTATTNYGINIGAISGAGTNNYGLFVGAVTGATGNNFAARFGGDVLIAQQTDSGGTTSNWGLDSQTTAGTIDSGGTASIAGVSAMAVYNGSLYVGTKKTDGAEVYRYDGGTGWTVLNATAGTFVTTANIDEVASMTVFNGYLYIGTSESNSAEVYRYDGGTSWTVMNGTAGTFATGCSNACATAIDGVTAMAVWGGGMYIGTSEADSAEVYEYQSSTTWVRVSNTTKGTIRASGTINIDTVSVMISAGSRMYLGTSESNSAEVYQFAGANGINGPVWAVTSSAAGRFNSTLSIDAATAMAVHNGYLYIGTSESNSAEVYRAPIITLNASATLGWEVVESSAGTIASGGTGSIDTVSSLTTYNGNLYLGTNESNSAEVYLYTTANTWSRVSQTTAGTIKASGTASIDKIASMIAFNNKLFVGTNEGTSAEVYDFSAVETQSFALKFNAVADAASVTETNNFLNTGSISFAAEQQAHNSPNSYTGSFLVSHSLVTTFSAYDVAEDYPTRDENLQPGDIVSIDDHEREFVKQATTSYSTTMVGVYSEKPGLRLSQKETEMNGGKAIPVALVGRVPVKVSTENGQIQKGDYLTSSSTPGVAMKATRPGPVIGKALEDFEQDCLVANAPRNDVIASEVKQSSCQGKIMVFVNISFADPNSILANLSFDGNGNLYTPNLRTDTLTTNTVIANEVKQSQSLTGIASSSAHPCQAGDLLRCAQSDPRNDVFELSKDPLFTNLQQTVTDLQQKIDLLESQLISNATSSTSLLSSIASSSAILGATTYSLQPTPSSSSSANLTALADLDVQTATVSGNLIVTGRTLLNDLGVTGKIQTGLLTIDGLNNEINTLAGELKLQSNKLAGIDILNGTVLVDTNGNITTVGTVSAKEIKTDKITITDSQASTSSTVLSRSIGTEKISSQTTVVTVKTTTITPTSKVFLTPTTPTDKVLSVTNIKNGQSFDVVISSKSSTDISFNWWLVEAQ